jgi:hypothetical protein
VTNVERELFTGRAAPRRGFSLAMGKVACRAGAKLRNAVFPRTSCQMTALSWQFRSGKEQQIHAVAGTVCVRILGARKSDLTIHQSTITIINPSSNRRTALNCRTFGFIKADK